MEIHGKSNVSCDKEGLPPDLYMKRWMLLPHNRFFNVYLHHFVRGDNWLHDHPYHFLAFAFWGRGVERLEYEKDGKYICMYRQVGKRFRFYRSKVRHVITDVDNLWTIAIRGPVHREWGMVIENGDIWGKWVHYRTITEKVEYCGRIHSHIRDTWLGWGATK